MSESANTNGGSGVLKGVVSLCVLLGGLWYFFGGGVDQQAAHDMANIAKKVASDAVDQYRIAARSGTEMDRCVQAGMVTAAYLQAKDEGNYQAWKQVEHKDCSAAGMPEQ